eukprot:CAMPEP_0204142262 /NCGR_PEP_ID=MMETSP0361-20130328/19896_1 /ASSEMBLY_ACC=CAM_ASM_000343 /TAXON_ID=268821 /ORGANISM="Scrippsiella Hangoei, Strain SHTV-5" /LENGTH=314 /DNA_ID=CAMNT_0051096083 /DNA_START=1 /DNA_END=941 /DNA_ORIENTATION=-
MGDRLDLAADTAAASSPERQLRSTVATGSGSIADVSVVTGGCVPASAVPGAGVASTRISPDAVALLDWLRGAAGDYLGKDTSSRVVLPAGDGEGLLLLELGCGVGVVGLTCAALKPRARLVLTDAPEVLSLADRSIASNDHDLAARCIARPLPFGDEGALREVLAEMDYSSGRDSGSAHLLAIGAGIFYWECVFVPLAKTLEDICSAGGRALLGYFRRDWKVERRLWTKLLPQHGLNVEVLWEGIVPAPQDTECFAPVCTRTPGEWNARIYFVTSASGESKGSLGDSSPDHKFQPWLAYNGALTRRQGKQGSDG